MTTRRLLTSCFGLGLMPGAPGTWGSVPPVIIFMAVAYLAGAGVWTALIMGVLLAAGSIVCVRFSPEAIAATGSPDPAEVVADEFAGQALTLLAVATVPRNLICSTAIIGFAFFRFFDIAKPWPIRKLERLPDGWGILADDLLAGVYAGVGVLLSLKIGLVGYLGRIFSVSGGSITLFDAAWLGAVQGLTEFLPVSSSGHLVLLETLFNFDPETPPMLLFDLAVHAGTVAAILYVFRKSIASFFGNLLASGKYLSSLETGGAAGNNRRGTPARQAQTPVNYASPASWRRLYQRSPSIRFLTLAILATFVTGVCGLALQDYFVAARGSPLTVAAMWAITGTLLIITDSRKKSRRGLRNFTLWHAAIVGLVQAAAIMPGISRSGATICAAILLGLHRRWAVEFSFLLAIPAILGAGAVQLIRNLAEISSGALAAGTLVTGLLVAAVTGVFALKLLLNASRRANLKFFAFYCYALACCTLLYFLL